MTKNALLEIDFLKNIISKAGDTRLSQKQNKEYSILRDSKNFKKFSQKRILVLCKFAFENGDLDLFLEKIFSTIFQRNQIHNSINYIVKELLENFPKLTIFKDLEKVIILFYNLTNRNFQNNKISERLNFFKSTLLESKGSQFPFNSHTGKNQIFESVNEEIDSILECIRIRLDNLDFSGAGIYVNKFFKKNTYENFDLRHKISLVEQLIRIFFASKELSVTSYLYFSRAELLLSIGVDEDDLKRELTIVMLFSIHIPIKRGQKWSSLFFLLRIWENFGEKMVLFLFSSNCNFPRSWSFFKENLMKNILNNSIFSSNSFYSFLKSLRSFFIQKNLKILFENFKVLKEKRSSLLTEIDYKDLEHWIFFMFESKEKVQIDFLKKNIRIL